LKQNSFSIKSSELVAPDDDLKFLKGLLKDKRIVSMGEATHGTKQFAQLKCRFFKYLVENLDFNIMAIEADFGVTMAVNDYVLGINDDGREALKKLLFFHCVNEETWELIEWMRLYNKKFKERQVKIYGIDYQFAYRQLDIIKKYFSKVDTVFFQEIEEYEEQPPLNFYGPCLAIEDTKKIRNRLQGDSARYILTSGALEWEEMLHLTYTLEDFYFLRQQSINRNRDLCMKKNIEWILEHEGSNSKVLVWAHNLHVMYDSLPWKGKGYFKLMGLCLKDSYRDELYTIGFDFNKGRFLANRPMGLGKKELTVYDIASAPSGTLANTLSKVPSNMFFIDIATAAKYKAIRDKWHGSVLMRNIGGMIPEVCVIEQSCSFVPLPLLNAYDGLIFVNETLEVTRLK
jgi:erythromycin esterase